MTMDRNESKAVNEVERLTKIGKEKLRQGQTKKAVADFQSAYEHSQVLGQHGYMQRACAFNLGAILISTRKFEDGLIFLNKAKPPENRKDGKSHGDFFFNFGLAYEGMKNYVESINYYKKALEEYTAEQNKRMVVDVYERLLKLSKYTGNALETNMYLKELTEALNLKDDKEKYLRLQMERAHLLYRLDKTEQAEEVAEKCLKDTDNASSITGLGTILVELGVFYTKIQDFEKAIYCTKSALESEEDALKNNPKSNKAVLIAVLHQNLGAIYNHQRDFEEAIKHHKQSIDAYGKLHDRKLQCQCFMNLAYAYSQLNDMEKAGESYLHSLQAAKDSGDKKTEWQSLEGLGAVRCSKQHLDKAEEHYKEALTVFSQSPQSTDSITLKRILQKLEQIQSLKLKYSQKPKLQTLVKEHGLTDTSQVPTLAKMLKASGNKQDDMGPDSQREGTLTSTGKQKSKTKVVALKRGGITRFVKMKRSGTLRLLTKPILDADFSTPRENFNLMEAEDMEDEDIDDLTSVDESECEESSDEESDSKDSVLKIVEGNQAKYIKLKKSGVKRRFSMRTGSGVEEGIYEVLESEGELDAKDGAISEEDESDDEEEDENARKSQHVRPADSYLPGAKHRPITRSLLESEDGEDQMIDEDDDDDEDADNEEEEEKELVREAMRKSVYENDTERENLVGSAKPETVSSEGTTDTCGSSESDSDEDDEDIAHRQKGKKPPLPASSPPTTSQVNGDTYEHERTGLHYETIDHRPPSGHREKKQVTIGETQNSSSYENNYFHAEAPTMQGLSTGEATVYESIRPQTRRGRNSPSSEGESDDNKKQDTEESDSDTERPSRGQRDIEHYEKFRSDKEKFKDQAEKSEGGTADERQKSKVCSIM